MVTSGSLIPATVTGRSWPDRGTERFTGLDSHPGASGRLFGTSPTNSAGTGRLSLVLVLVLAGIASLASDVIWYWIGRLGGGRVLSFLCRISLEPDSCVRRTEESFSRQGARSLLFAKFVPGYSTAAPPLAGIVRMGFARFLVFTGAGGLIWAG